MQPEVGARLGPYELVSLIGTGGMGRVFRARDVELRRYVAIKIINDESAGRPGAVARFEREARLASSLNHPGIVTIYGVGVDQGVRYIAMELIDGSTLRELIESRSLRLDRAVGIAAQVAAALAKAHAAGIVHRDLKPQNVMVTTDGLVKILDFGLSMLEPPLQGVDGEMTTSDISAKTAEGAIVGTTFYMSPEQATGRPVDFRSDQFAFGSIFYEMLTGRRAFQRPSAVQTLAAIVEDAPQPLGLASGVPELLPTMVARCLAKNPSDRYGSTQDLASDMRVVREQLAAASSRTRSAVAVGAAPGRRTAAISAALIAAAAIAIGVAVWPRISFAPSRAPSVSPVKQQLVVLPFANVGGEPDTQLFTDGLVETLTSQLTQLSQFASALEVVPASDVRREGVTSVRDARRAFGVSRVITGSVQRTPTNARITVNLVDADTLRQLNARSIDIRPLDVATMQDAIVRQVADLLGASLRPEAQQAITAGGTTVPGAFELYLQAKGHLQRFDADHVEVAINLLQRAVAQDPNYALAHAGLGEAYWHKYELTKDRKWVEAARASSTEALGLTDRLAPAHVTLGLIEAGTGRPAEAVDELKRAIALDPSSEDAYRELANAFQALGRTLDAEATYKTAIQVRPSYWASYNALGRFYFRLSRYDDAEQQFRRVIELVPDNAIAYSSLGAIYFSTKRYGQAEEMFRKSAAIKPSATAYSNLGTLYFTLGRYGEAARMMEQALTMNAGDSTFWSNLASTYYWAPGERPKAHAAYEHALTLAQEEARVNPRSPTLLVRMADCHSRLGDNARARRLLEEALGLAPEDVSIQARAATVFEQLGDRQRALQLLLSALAHGYSRDVVERSPELVALRADPRFTGR